LRTLKALYPAYAERVGLVAVGSQVWESDASASRFAEGGGYPWPTVLADPQVVRDYAITAQSSAVGIDAEGVVLLRDGYGTSGEEAWRALLERLAAGS
jgi:hypothetical protein